MSKLIELLVKSNHSGQGNEQNGEMSALLQQEAVRLYQQAADQMRLQRQGFTQEYKETREQIDHGIAVSMTNELSKVNLQNYNRIKVAILFWNPPANSEHFMKFQKIRQVLLEMLPVAQKKQQLQSACTQYRIHLQSEIKSEMASDSSTHNGSLKKAMQKYEAVERVQATLHTTKPATEQVRDFRQIFPQTKSVIEKDRDSVGTFFLKTVATIFSLGIAALMGIWSVKGQETGEKLGNILAMPTTAVTSPKR